MTATPSTRIDRTTLHLINDHDADEAYQAEILYLVDGTVIGYRLDPAESGGFTFTPLENGMADDITVTAQLIDAR